MESAEKSILHSFKPLINSDQIASYKLQVINIKTILILK